MKQDWISAKRSAGLHQYVDVDSLHRLSQLSGHHGNTLDVLGTYFFEPVELTLPIRSGYDRVNSAQVGGAIQ